MIKHCDRLNMRSIGIGIMRNNQSNVQKKTLQNVNVHQRWNNAYYDEDNERFYTLAFDYLKKVLGKPEPGRDKLLDAGCGSGIHSIRMARQGFLVTGVDFSESTLKIAQENIQKKHFQDSVVIQQGDLTQIEFKDESFDCILCWGVLMHVPDIEAALNELSRVLKKGGILIISEANMHSLQIRIYRRLSQLLGKNSRKKVYFTKLGVENWKETEEGDLLIRHFNIDWLKQRLINDGFVLKDQVPCQFTELYLKIPFLPIKKLIHAFNRFWFSYIKNSRLAFGNIVLFEKAS